MKSSMLRWAVLTTAAGLPCLLVGCGAVAAPPPAQPARVTVQHPVSREVVDYKYYNGWTDAYQNVEIRSRVRGHIHDIKFTDGEVVEKDALLFQLDPRPFEADLQVAESQVEVAKSQQEFALAEEARQQELFAKNVATKADLQEKIAARKSWDARVIAAQQTAERSKLDLEYSRITAPLKGKIGRALLDRGNLVNAGGSDPVLTTIVALDPIRVYFYVDERALLEYRQRTAERIARTHDQPLKESKIPFDFGLETDQGYPNPGTLDFAENKIDARTGTIEVRGEAGNAESRFLPGSRVRVRVPVSDPYQALLVPDVAILSDQDQRYVLCLNAENVVVRRTITPGRLLDDGMRVILPGPNPKETVGPTDWIITLGLQRARVNYPVEPMDENGQPIEVGNRE